MKVPPSAKAMQLLAREIVCEEWGKAVKEFELRPGSITEKVVSRIINRLDELE